MPNDATSPTEDLLAKTAGNYSTILADPPWQFSNRTGKVAPEHRRLNRYGTLTLDEIKAIAAPPQPRCRGNFPLALSS